MEQLFFQTVTMFCPHCGHKVKGQKSEDGSVRIECKKCGSVLFSKMRRPSECAIRVIQAKAV